jgi:hypothetical protein
MVCTICNTFRVCRVVGIEQDGLARPVQAVAVGGGCSAGGWLLRPGVPSAAEGLSAKPTSGFSELGKGSTRPIQKASRRLSNEKPLHRCGRQAAMLVELLLQCFRAVVSPVLSA